MAIYAGETECQMIYVARNGQQLRVSSVWVGDKQVFPPTNRQEVHAFTRDTQGYGREDYGTRFAFTVPVPWWAASADVVIVGAGEKGRDGTQSFLGGEDGAGGRSGAWVVKTTAIIASENAMVSIGKGTSTAPAQTGVVLLGSDGQSVIEVHDGEGTRTASSGSTGGSVTPRSRAEYDQTHTGGAGGSRNNPGSHPGGGGGGGQGANLIGTPQKGRDGGDGYVWLRFRSAPAPDPGYSGFVLTVGVASGFAYDPLRDWAASIGKTHQTITEITVPIEVVGTSLYSLFSSCSSLTTIPDMDTSQVTYMHSMFLGCSSLTSIPDLDSSSVTNANSMFQSCSSLKSVALPGMGNGFTTKRALDMRYTKLNAAAANALMESLGTPSPGGDLQLPATAAGADTSIAASKNWTVTFG